MTKSFSLILRPLWQRLLLASGLLVMLWALVAWALVNP